MLTDRLGGDISDGPRAADRDDNSVKQMKTPRSELRGVGEFRSTHEPTLASSSFVITF